MTNPTVPSFGRVVPALLALLVVGIAACKDDATAPPVVATNNARAPINAQTVAVLTNQTVTVPGGGAAFSPAVAGQNVTIAFGSTPTQPQLTVGSTTVRTSLTFSSAAADGIPGASFGPIIADQSTGTCTFTVLAPGAAAPFTTGASFPVSPCAINIPTSGQVVGTTNTGAQITLSLGTSTSTPIPATTTVAPNGTVTVSTSGGTAAAGTVTVAPGTGGRSP